MLWVLLGFLLLVPGMGCVDFEQEGVGFCEKRPDQCVPALEDVVQESALPSGQISFRVTAKDGAAERLAFKWEASIGTLETVRTTSTSSMVLWNPPACLLVIQSGTVSVSVENSHGHVSKEFKVSVAACPKPTFPLTPTPSISSRGHHSLALLSDGSVWAWGRNDSGQLGDGTVRSRTFASQVSDLEKVAAISSGYAHSLALRDDGTVWAWGGNDYGQLGLGWSLDQVKPARIPDLGEIIFLSAGVVHSLALSRNGAVWAWGDNEYGQLGAGSPASSPKPVAVNLKNVSGVVALAAGWAFSMALCENGEVWVWGDGFSGTSSASSGAAYVPRKVYGLPGIAAIAVGRRHALALAVDGTVWAWGSNDSGQLGLGDRDFESSPKQIPGLSKIRAIAAGPEFSIALGSQGEVWAWGLNDSGQLGRGPTSPQRVPNTVSAISAVSFISAGEHHVSTIRSDGVFWIWGDDGAGGIKPLPRRVP
ncbi:hypothetical protein F0U62_01960 [Cystobacter fuscus]|nr:hypothetical protein F0U62_01960 [Cystobacter fuscus]